jgi:ABC-2 type transport system ATP-binding protein
MIEAKEQSQHRLREQDRAPTVIMRGAGKRYGTRWAIRDVDLTLHAGDVLGFIGPNGAGKTTLMKLMAGLSRASAGEIIVLGERLDGRLPRTPDGIGLVLEQIGFIPYLSGRKNLQALASIRNEADTAMITATLELVGLDPADKRPVRAYSLGMRQRLGLAQALMEQPKLLLLDEPTNGLDPAGIVDLRHLLRRLADQGVTIFLASHLLTEVERVCDRVLLVRQGEVVRAIVPAREQIWLRVVVTDETDAELLLNWARRLGVAVERAPAHGEHPAFQIAAARPTPRIVRELVDVGVNVEEIGLARQSLEEAFMALVGSTEAR